MKLPLLQRVYRSIARHTSTRIAQDLGFEIQRQARDASVDFLKSHALGALGVANADAVLDLAVKEALNVDGCYCEFGVFKGRTLRRIARHVTSRPIYGFDSFEGLPESWRVGFDAGRFKTSVPRFRQPNVSLRVGWFDDTVPQFAASLVEPVAFAHIDCDLYSSTKTVLANLRGHLTLGSVLLFDEYFNYPGWEMHEHRALQELVASGDLQVRYLAYNEAGQQLAAVVTGGSMISTHTTPTSLHQDIL
jgi:hypothetical protein